MKRILYHPLVLSLFVVAVFIFSNWQGWLETPKDIFFRLTGQGQKIIYQFSLRTDNFIRFFVSIKGLEQENIRHKQNNERLLGELALLREVSRENEFLREQIALSAAEPNQLILADVIGYNLSGLEKYLLINKGERDGVKEKAAVITAGNVLVGQITETLETFSKVRLISDPSSRVNSIIQESRTMGLVKGDRGLDFFIDLLPQGRDIKKGETIISSGLAGFFPSGLLIGHIQEIISSDAQISQTAKIDPAADFTRLEKVFVIVE